MNEGKTTNYVKTSIFSGKDAVICLKFSNFAGRFENNKN